MPFSLSELLEGPFLPCPLEPGESLRSRKGQWSLKEMSSLETEPNRKDLKLRPPSITSRVTR
jgi:hypothetical protein